MVGSSTLGGSDRPQTDGLVLKPRASDFAMFERLKLCEVLHPC